MTALTVTFPPPPSGNKIWRNVKGRTLKSAEYRGWVLEAVMGIRLSLTDKAARIVSACAVSLRIPRKSKLSDLDNRIKPCLDALQAAGVIQNDRQIVRIIAQWAEPDATHVRAEIVGVEA